MQVYGDVTHKLLLQGDSEAGRRVDSQAIEKAVRDEKTIRLPEVTCDAAERRFYDKP
jgi:hypothetical protein